MIFVNKGSNNMKICHVCLACFYVENMGYQENILPQLHVKMGHDVFVLTSDYSFNNKYETVYREHKNYTNSFGVNVKILNRSTRYGYLSRFNDYDGVYDSLTEERPDIIFVHGGQFIALLDIIKYCKQFPHTKLFIDQHADWYNTPVKTLKQNITQRLIYGFGIRKAVPYVSTFWGVTPWRCEYLNKVYKVPKEKIKLLVMGGDDRYIHLNDKIKIRQKIRKELDLNDNDFVLITGGKIDSAKNIDVLMRAVAKINKTNLKLIVFGQPNEQMHDIIKSLSRDEHIRNIGWINSKSVYDYFLASDLAIFPGTHSVLWEQACACGIPGVFKDWAGMHHVDVGGNARFIKGTDITELISVISELSNLNDTYTKMKNIAQTKAIKVFSYKEIAKLSIGANK